MPVDRIAIVLVDPSSGELRSDFVSGSALTRTGSAATQGINQGILDEVRATGKAARFDDIPGVTSVYPGVENLAASGFKSGIYAPLAVRGAVIGVIGIVSQTLAAYTDTDLELLVRISDQIAGSVASVQIHRQMERELQDRELLAEIGRVASSTLDLDEILDRRFETLGDLIPSDRVSIMIVSGTPALIYERGMAVESSSSQHVRNTARDGLPALVSATGQSRLIDDLQDALADAPGAAHVVEAGLSSCILAPLKSDGDVIAVIAVCAKQRAAYETHDLNLLERLAHLLTGTIVNSQLHAAVEEQARQEALLAEIGRVATSTSEMEAVFGRIAELFSTIAEFDGMSLSTIDDSRETMTVRFVVGDKISGFPEGQEQALEGSHTGQVLKSRTAVIISGDEIDELGVQFPYLGEFDRRNNIRSRMVIPIVHIDQPVGSIAIHSKDPNAYTQHHLRLAERVANQISGALANAELRAALAQTTLEDEVLAEISQAVTASPVFAEVFDTVVALVSKLIQFDRMAIASQDVETGRSHVRFVAGTPMEGFKPGDSNYIPEQILYSDQLVNVGWIFQSDEYRRQNGVITESPALDSGLRFAISVNLRSHGKLIGHLAIRSKLEFAYEQRDLDLAIRVASQLSGAFANSELHAEVERRAMEESVLARIGRELGSPLDRTTVLRRILSGLSDLVPADHVSIATVSDGSENLEYLYLSGVAVDTGHGEDRVSPSPTGITTSVMESGKAFVLNDISSEVDRSSGLKRLLDRGLNSVVMLPLVWDGATIGVLGISATESNAYGDHQVDLARRVADQLAGWVANGRLLSNLEHQARVDAVLADIGRDAGSSLDLNRSLENLKNHLDELLPSDRVTVIAGSDTAEGFRTVYFKGLDVQTGVGPHKNSPTPTGMAIDVVKKGVPILTNALEEMLDEFPGVKYLLDAGLRSMIIVPLRWEDEIVGIFAISAQRANAYRPGDLELVERIAQLLAGAVVNSELHDRAETRANEEAVLAAIGRLVNSAADIDDVYEQFARMAVQLVPADRVLVSTIEDAYTFRERHLYGPRIPGREPGELLPLDGSLTGHIVKTGLSQMWHEDAEDDDFIARHPVLRQVIDAGIKALLTVPLAIRGEVFGAVHFSQFAEHQYTQHERLLAEAVANQIAGGITGARLLEESSHRAIEESMLADISEVVSSSLDLNDVFPGFAEKLSLLLPAVKIDVNRIDHDSEEWVRIYAWFGERESDEQSSRGPLRGSATEHVAEQRQIVLFGDPGKGYLPHSKFPGVESHLRDGVKSTLLAPLLVGADVIGVLSIHSDEPDAYTQYHVELCRRVASVVASAVANSSLLKAAENDARERGLLAEIGRLFSSSLEIDELCKTLAEPFRQLVPYDRFMIATYEREHDVWITRYEAGMPAPQAVLDGPYDDREPVRRLLDTRSTLVIRDHDDSNQEFRFSDYPTAGLRSSLFVPIVAKDRVVGTIMVHSSEQNFFHQRRVDLGEQVARQIAGAFDNAALHEQTVRDAEERESLAEIGRVVGSTLELDDLWPRFVDEFKQLFHYDRLAVSLYDEAERKRWTEFVDGIPVEGAAPRDSLPYETAGTALTQARQPFLVKDSASGARDAELLGPVMVALGFRSMIAIPIVFNDDLIGSMDLKSKLPGMYTQRDLHTLTRVADLIAGAIANSRLLTSANRQAQEEEALSDIGRLVSGSLDFASVVEQLAVSINRLVPYDRIGIMGLDAEAGLLWSQFVVGRDLEGWGPGTSHRMNSIKYETFAIPVGGVRYESTNPDDPLTEILQAAHLNSSVIVPMIWEDRTVGAISVRSEQIDGFTEHHQELLVRVSQQITGAFVNSELYAITTMESAERRTLAEIGRLVSSSLNVNEMFEAIADPVAQLIPYDRLTITTIDADSTVWTTRFTFGMKMEGFEPGDRNVVLPSSRSDAVLAKQAVLAAGDALQGGLFTDDQAKSVGLNSSMQIPLVVAGELIGVLGIRAVEENVYGQKHLELARRIGNQIAGSVANAELHAITAREAEERLVLAEIGRLVSSSLKVEEIFEAIAEPFSRLIPNERFSVSIYDAETDTWTPKYVKGPQVPGYEIGDTHTDVSDIGRQFALEQKPVIATSQESSSGVAIIDDFREAGLVSALLVPLVINGEVIGAMSARTKQPDAYTDDHAELARRIGLQIAGSVANSELHRALADNEARTRAIVETAAVGIVTANGDLEIESVNDALLESFGYTRDELLGRHVSILASEPYRSEHLEYERRYHRTGIPHMIGSLREVLGRRKDGTQFPIELEITRVELDHGTMYTGVIRDITDRKIAEDQVVALNSELELRVQERTAQLLETNSELEAFSYTVSHDLRGPLAMSARLATRLLELDQGSLPELSRKYVELIARSSQESSELVADLLNFARLGHQALTIREVDPGKVAALAQADIGEASPNVRWTLKTMPPCQADEVLLRIVYVNLLNNAYKFTRAQPEPFVEAGAIDRDGQPIYYVRDNGVGLDMANAHRVFDVFERLHRPEDYPGSGAGLAIVRRIVERHGGEVWVESEEGKGATFFFTMSPVDAD
jgi:PAS domain S-box-containing protein